MAQFENTIYVKTDTDEFTLQGRPCELSAFSFIPLRRNLPKQRTFYNVDQLDRYPYGMYDRLFQHDFGYNDKVHRSDREHAKSLGLCVNCEEQSKCVPSRSSSIYGHCLPDPPFDPPDRKYVRIGVVKSEFYRRNGVNMTSKDDVPLK